MSTNAAASCPIGSIGERFNPLERQQLEDPYPFYAEARRDQAVFFSSAVQMWVVTAYEPARAVLNNPAVFSARNALKSIVEFSPEALAILATGVPEAALATNSDPPEHARWRKVLNSFFSAARIRGMEPEIRQITQARVDAAAAVGHSEVLADFGYPIPLQVVARLCDVGDEHLDDLERWGRNFVALISSQLEPVRQIEVAKEFVEYQKFLVDHIERKRAKPGDDIVSELLAGGGDVPFSESELVSALVNLFVAGHDTTAHLIGNALHRLLSEPALWCQVVADPGLIPAAVEETLRIDAPVPAFIRTATTATELAGQRIAKGDNVLVGFAAANHDPEQFTEPESFDLHRKDAAKHLTFGHGIHHCVGAPLARLEARVVLESLVMRFPNLRLAPDQQLRHLPTLILRGFERLEVEWD